MQVGEMHSEPAEENGEDADPEGEWSGDELDLVSIIRGHPAIALQQSFVDEETPSPQSSESSDAGSCNLFCPSFTGARLPAYEHDAGDEGDGYKRAWAGGLLLLIFNVCSF